MTGWRESVDINIGYVTVAEVGNSFSLGKNHVVTGVFSSLESRVIQRGSTGHRQAIIHSTKETRYFFLRMSWIDFDNSKWGNI